MTEEPSKSDRRTRLAIAASAAMSVLTAGEARSAPMVTGCGPAQPPLAQLRPADERRMRLSSVTCFGFKDTSNPFTAEPPEVSPDARWIAKLRYPGLVEIAPLGAHDAAVSAATPQTFQTFARSSKPAARWSSTSRFVWTARQALRSPSHFSTGPLRPVRVWRDGRVEEITAPGSIRRSLDAILWIGGDGLGLVQVGTRGGYYRPERPDPNPTLAFVDFAKGTVLQRLRLRELPVLRKLVREDRVSAALTHAEAFVAPDGRARAILRLGSAGWMSWTQGETPRRLALPHDDAVAIAAAAKGGRIVVAPRLMPYGAICEIWNISKWAPPTPVAGIFAAMHEANGGPPIWTAKAVAANFADPPSPPSVPTPGSHS